ncbi:MAG: MaoC family dehydratase [Alphaproteobacteria bacterium]
MSGRYLEDFAAGQRFTTPGVTVTESQIIDFALAYDPQPFHLDREAAKASIFGQLVASGFHTLALSFRLFYQTGVIAQCNLAAPSVDELKFLRPVRAGDTIRVEVEVMDARPSASKPDRGTLRLRYATLNQDGDAVVTMVVPHIVRRRPPE